MDTVKTLAGSFVAPKLLRRVGWKWIAFGVVAYYGLRLLNKKGVLPTQTNAALGLIDKGIDMAKGQLGMSQQGAAAGSQAAGAHKPPASLHADGPSIH